MGRDLERHMEERVRGYRIMRRTMAAAGFAALLCVRFAAAATFYISPSGDDRKGKGTSAAPWRTATKAFKKGGGHTYVWMDGLYNYEGGNIVNPPSGSPDRYTVLKAENDGGAVLSGYAAPLLAEGVGYAQFEGFTIKDGTGGEAILTLHSHHLKFLRIGIKNGVPWDARHGNVVAFSSGSEYILAEDLWVTGAMRYGILTYAADGTNTRYIILRRCVVRFDGSGSVEPKAGIANYGSTSGIAGSSDILMQNCLALDFNDTDNAAGEGLYAGFYNPHSGKRTRNYGSIALNIPASGFIINEDADSRNNEVHNCLAWNVRSVGFMSRNASGPTIMNQVTAGRCKTDGGFRSYGASAAVWITNSVFVDNGEANHGATLDNFNLYFPPTLQPAGALNPMTLDPKIMHLPMIPGDSPAYRSGMDGLSRGAVILKRYGVSGTLWGEPGYNQLTDQFLWPWPHEKRIHELFAEDDNINGNVTARGFAVPGQTLTRYIWEYLGSRIPESIYAGRRE